MPDNHNVPLARRIIGAAILLAIGGASIYSAWAYRGPYRWLAELQLQYGGSYEEQITFILSLALIAAPFGLAFFLYRRFSPKPASTPSATPSPRADAAIQLFLARYSLGIIFICVGLFFFFTGAKDYWSGIHGGALQDVSISDFEHGKLPGSTWIALRGQTLLDKSQGAGDSNSSMIYYIPVVSPDWHEGIPIAAFIEVRNSDMTEDLKNSNIHRHAGLLASGGLPGMVRVAFERDGITPSENYILLKYNHTPANAAKTGRDMLLLSSCFILGGAALAIYTRFKSRSRPSTAPQPATKTYGIKSILPAGNTSSGPTAMQDRQN